MNELVSDNPLVQGQATEGLARQESALTLEEAVALERESRLAVEAEELQAYQLTLLQAETLVAYRNNEELGGDAPVDAVALSQVEALGLIE